MKKYGCKEATLTGCARDQVAADACTRKGKWPKGRRQGGMIAGTH